jgi:ABC-type tungstate transport system substrate-binding protein
MNIQYISISFGIVLALVVILAFNKTKKAILSLFGGSIELPEFGGVVFLGLFIYMIIKEGGREHQWHYYNELYIFFVAGAAMTGLGLSKVLDTVKEIRLGTKQENKSANDFESESPK